MIRPLRACIAAATPLASALALYACSSEQRSGVDLGEPPEGGIYDPGLGASNGAYGSGYGGSPSGPQKPEPYVCPVPLRRCGVTFSIPAGAEKVVEVRGDFGGSSTWEKGVPMTKVGDTWTATVPIPQDKKVYYKYCIEPKADNPKDCEAWKVDATKPTEGTAPFDNNVLEPVTCTEYLCEKDPPDEGAYPPGVFDWRDSVMYFVMVDRFFDSDGKRCAQPVTASGPISSYLGGDWKGVEAKIPYLKSLGVNTLWLTVPMDNTAASGKGTNDDFLYSGYHGYWPADLDSAEDCFGSEAQTVQKSLADLQSLVGALHKNGMKALLDFAMVHVHTDSPVWQQHKDWFWGPDQGGCVCGSPGCDWNEKGLTCWFTNYLPHFNYKTAAARDYSVGRAMDWIKKAAPAGEQIDGFRLDAIKHVEDSWLTDLRQRVQTEIVSKMPAGSRFYMVGETFDYSPSYLATFVDPDKRLDGQFDFPERAAIVESVLMKRQSMAALASFMTVNRTSNYGPRAVMSPFLGNHDIARVIHLAETTRPWSDENVPKSRAWITGTNAELVKQPTELAAYERLGNGFAVLFTNRGAPLIYYGDEVGLAGAADPDNRRPMPFCAAANLSADAKTIGRVCTEADGEPAWNEGQKWLKDRVAKLAAIRAAHPSLRRGTLETLELPADVRNDVWAYKRTAELDTVYVVVNRADEDKTVNVLPEGTYDELIEGGTAAGASPTTLPKRQTRIFQKK